MFSGKSKWVALGALFTIFAFSAQAGTPGWYIGGEGGATFQQDSNNSFRSDAAFTPATDPTFLIDIPGLGQLIQTDPGTPATFTPGQRVGFETSNDIGFIGGATVGRLFESGLRLELEARYSQNDFDEVSNAAGDSNNADGDINSIAIMANGWFDFNAAGALHPYIGGGIGGARVEVRDFSAQGTGGGGFTDDDVVLAYQGGAGINFDITDRTTIDLGYRYFATEDPGYNTSGGEFDFEYEQHVALLSLRYVFAPTGRTDSDGDGVPDVLDKCPNTPAGAPVDSNGCPLDSDGDGVPDYQDKCPNTAAGVPVGSDGCPLDADGDGVPDNLDECPNTPAGAPVDAKGCPLDSDGDGVPDYLDDCPNTPAGAVVNAKGCPTVVDSDGDGVPDDRDQCPDTPPGVPVTSTGCAADQVAILEGVKFEYDSAKLTLNAEKILDEVAQTLKDSPGFRIELSGHTDSKGADDYNQRLSQSRAESARRYLVNKGIDPSRIEAVGYGESRPIAPNADPDGSDNPEGRAKNRRTEFKVLGQ